MVMNSAMILAFKVLTFWSLQTIVTSGGAKYYGERYSWRGWREGIPEGLLEEGPAGRGRGRPQAPPS